MADNGRWILPKDLVSRVGGVSKETHNIGDKWDFVWLQGLKVYFLTGPDPQ